jgi:hypothetical protein
LVPSGFPPQVFRAVTIGDEYETGHCDPVQPVGPETEVRFVTAGLLQVQEENDPADWQFVFTRFTQQGLVPFATVPPSVTQAEVETVLVVLDCEVEFEVEVVDESGAKAVEPVHPFPSTQV